MFDIYGDFKYKEELFSKIKCDMEMFHEYWKVVLSIAIIREINYDKKLIKTELKYEEDGYLEYYGDYALISFDLIKESEIKEMKIDNILVYNEKAGFLNLKKRPPLTKEEKEKIKEKVDKLNKMFDFVMDKKKKEG